MLLLANNSKNQQPSSKQSKQHHSVQTANESSIVVRILITASSRKGTCIKKQKSTTDKRCAPFFSAGMLNLLESTAAATQRWLCLPWTSGYAQQRGLLRAPGVRTGICWYSNTLGPSGMKMPCTGDARMALEFNAERKAGHRRAFTEIMHPRTQICV